jgi:cytochrome c5
MPSWKRLLIGVAVVLGLVVVGAVVAVGWAGGKVEAIQARRVEIPAESLAPFAGQIDVNLGKRIVEVRAGCTDCHGKDLAGGTVVDDPALGRIDAPNITPATMANWSDDDIARSVRHGVDKEGRPLALMPSTDYTGMSGGDIASLVAYLRTVPAVQKERGQISFGPLGKLLIATGKLPTMFTVDVIDHAKGFSAKPPEAPTVEFGAYLAQACTGCHGKDFAGGPIPGGAPDWPAAADLTPRGIGAWSEQEFFQTLRTGVNPKGTKLRFPFPITLTSQMSDLELGAIYAFLRTIPTPSSH